MKEYFSFEQLVKDYKQFLLESKNKNSQKSFNAFLENNGYSIAHSQLIYESIVNGTPIKFDEEFTLEKTGKGSRFGKRLVAFGASFLGSFVVTMPLTAIAASIATVAGASAMGIQVMGNFWQTLINPALIGVGVGAVASTGYALSKTESKRKNLQLMNYKNWGFNAKYGSDKTMLNEFINQMAMNNGVVVGTKFDKLLEDITSFCEKSLVSEKSKKLFNNGRDRIHYLEFVSRKLVDKIYIIANKVNTGSLTKEDMTTLTAINMMLQRVANTVSKISEDSKAYALISGDHNGKHSHLIKNLDIFANLNNYHNEICEHIDPLKKAFTEADLENLRKSYHNLDKFNNYKKHSAAEEILNRADKMFIEEDDLLKKLAEKRKFKYSLDMPLNIVVVTINGVKYEIENVTGIANISNVVYENNNITIIYNDNSTKSYPTKNLKPKTDGPVVNNALLGQAKMLDYISGNFEAKKRLAHALMGANTSLTEQEALQKVDEFVRELNKSQKNDVVLRSRKNLPVQKLKAFLEEDWKEHKNDPSYTA